MRVKQKRLDATKTVPPVGEPVQAMRETCKFKPLPGLNTILRSQ